MRLTGSILVCALLFVGGSTFLVTAQSKRSEGKGAAEAGGAGQTSDQIEIKADRFSGITTVALKPQVILDKEDHQLTMEIKTKLGEKYQFDSERDEVKAEIWFRSQAKNPIDFGDQELHFLIDDQPLDIGRIPGGTDTDVDRS